MARFKFIVEAKVTKEVIVDIPSEELISDDEDQQIEQARELAHEQFTASPDENDEDYEETSSFSERVEDGQKFFNEQ